MKYEVEHANILKQELAEKYNATLTPSGYREEYYVSSLTFAYLDTMKPKHIPDGWNLKRPIDIVQTYRIE